MTAEPQGRLDTSDMFAVHQVFRDALSQAGDLVGSTEAGDVERAAHVGSFYGNVLEFLRVHHEGEDDLMFAKLLERRPGDSALISQVGGQHEDVHPLLDRTVPLVQPWAASADASAGAELAAALAELGEALGGHLDDEEQQILPLCSESLTMEEWGALPAHGMAAFRRDKIWLILGLIREHLSQGQRDEMLAHMPPPAVEMWTSMGESSYEAFVAELRRPPAPAG